MTKVVAWQYTNEIKKENIEQFELFAEDLDATFNTSAYAGMELSELDYVDENLSDDVEINIFFDNNEFFNKNVVEEELAKIAGINIQLIAIFEQDWQQESINSFKPIQIGRFYIHNFDEQTPEGKVSLKIPAKMAFGTGEHATTKGCLALYDELALLNNFKNGLDMGCGSAILAMAAYKADNVKFLAVDIDEQAVTIANDNLKENLITDNLQIICGDGFNAQKVKDYAPYDIIFANILKNPLLEMSQNLVDVLADKGYAILSGFKNDSQKQEIIQRYVKELNLKLISEFNEDGWSAICLKKDI